MLVLRLWREERVVLIPPTSETLSQGQGARGASGRGRVEGALHQAEVVVVGPQLSWQDDDCM